MFRNDGRIWAFAPGALMVSASVADVVLVSTMAVTGTLMAAAPLELVGALIGTVAAFALVLDQTKGIVFRRFMLIQE
jgi:H+-transporting ATPase